VRILWTKVGGLWPLHAGGRIRSFHVLRELARRHEVTFLTTHRSSIESHELARHLPADVRLVSVPHDPPRKESLRFALAVLRSLASPLPVDILKFRSPRLRAEIERRITSGEVDVCIADFLSATPNLPAKTPVPVVVFEHNVEYLIWKRLAAVESRPDRRALLALEWRKMRRYEAATCARAGAVVTVSEADRRVLAAEAPKARLSVLPTGVDTEYFTPNGTPELPGRLVFTGSMDWYPNEDGILHFLDDILPHIRRELPDVSLAVVGRNPSPRLRSLADQAGILVTGTVDDVRPHIAGAEVFVVPLRVGSGTRLKIFEALAMGKAVVSTRIGAEGLPIVPGHHFIEADDPSEFARAVVDLLRDAGRRKALGTAGREFVERHCSWSEITRHLENECERLVESHAS